MGNYGYFTLLIGAITPVIGTLGKQNDGGGEGPSIWDISPQL